MRQASSVLSSIVRIVMGGLVWLVDGWISFFVFWLRVAQDRLRLRESSCDAASCASAESVKGCFTLSIRIVAFFVPHLED